MASGNALLISKVLPTTRAARWACVAVLAAASGGCADAPKRQPPDDAVTAFSLLGSAQIASDTVADGTRVGGLSGLDRLADGRWVLISDDRSWTAPSRFYIASIALGADGIGQVDIERSVTLHDAAGKPYPQPGTGATAMDAEAVRVDPRSGLLWWSSEGDARDHAPQSVQRSDLDGHWHGVMPLPPMLLQGVTPQSGPRDNLAFEALAWRNGGDALWAATEGPLLQDGPMPDRKHGGAIRFNLFARDGQLLQQRLYRTAPVPAHADGRRAENGISDILDAGDDHLLVLERAVVEHPDGQYAFPGKLYCTAIQRGDDVRDVAALNAQPLHAAPKHLVLDLTRYPALAAINFEGMAWGPTLADGRRTLLLVSDNNFVNGLPTMLALFAVDPRQLGNCAG